MAALIRVRHTEQGTRGRRQNIANPEIYHAEMRVLRSVRNYEPGRAGQIGILNVRLQRPISCVLPESLQPIESSLLNGAVVCVSRAGSAVSDNRPGFRSVTGIGEEIPSVIIRTIINRKGFFLAGSPFETYRACPCMHHG